MTKELLDSNKHSVGVQLISKTKELILANEEKQSWRNMNEKRNDKK